MKLNLAELRAFVASSPKVPRGHGFADVLNNKFRDTVLSDVSWINENLMLIDAIDFFIVGLRQLHLGYHVYRSNRMALIYLNSKRPPLFWKRNTCVLLYIGKFVNLYP